MGDSEVMFPMFSCGEAEMATSLASDAIAELAESLREVASREVAGKPHTAITSSRTWCSLTTLGCFPSSK